MSKRAKILALIVGAAVAGTGAFIGVSAVQRIPGSAQEAIKRFQEQEAAEDQLMDPLILAGTDAVPLIEPIAADREEPRRRYAIGALGNIGAPSSVPLLERLVQDQGEEAYIRCDALTAIALIDREAAQRLVGQAPVTFECSTTADALRDYAAWRTNTYMRRSYLQALLGRHD